MVSITRHKEADSWGEKIHPLRQLLLVRYIEYFYKNYIDFIVLLLINDMILA